jgi:hypothetical protein
VDKDTMEILTKIKDDVAEIKTSQKVMEKDISHHIKRTDLAEESIKLLRDDLKPIKTHVDQMNGGLKLLGAVSLVLGIVATALKLFGII